MVGDRSRYGMLVSALGAIVLAVSVFLPWYGVSLTGSGVAFVQQFGDNLAKQLDGVSLQGYADGLHTSLAALSSHELAAVSAHQVLHDLNVILLVLAGLAMLDALVPLARSGERMPGGAGGAVVLLGALACTCVLYRMVYPPVPAGGMIALSLREGAWLALLGSLAMLLGGIWPRYTRQEMVSDAALGEVWSSFSGWTPQS